MTQRYRVECLNPGCGWIGYRKNAYECECYDYPCRPTSHGMGCPNGANLRANCPRCQSNWDPAGLKSWGGPEYFLVREVWTRAEVHDHLRYRAKRRREQRNA
jgi:hypothetical protein